MQQQKWCEFGARRELLEHRTHGHIVPNRRLRLRERVAAVHLSSLGDFDAR